MTVSTREGYDVFVGSKDNGQETYMKFISSDQTWNWDEQRIKLVELDYIKEKMQKINEIKKKNKELPLLQVFYFNCQLPSNHLRIH